MEVSAVVPASGVDQPGAPEPVAAISLPHGRVRYITLDRVPADRRQASSVPETMRKLIGSVLVATIVTACGRQSASPMDEALQADLQAATASTIELAPRAQGTKVVSAIESRQPTQPKVAPVRRVTGPAPQPEPETRQPTRTAETNEPTATRPTTTPAVQPPPPGGYKTVNEVIRNAPFPIKP